MTCKGLHLVSAGSLAQFCLDLWDAGLLQRYSSVGETKQVAFLTFVGNQDDGDFLVVLLVLEPLLVEMLHNEAVSDLHSVLEDVGFDLVDLCFGILANLIIIAVFLSLRNLELPLQRIEMSGVLLGPIVLALLNLLQKVSSLFGHTSGGVSRTSLLVTTKITFSAPFNLMVSLKLFSNSGVVVTLFISATNIAFGQLIK